MFDALSFLFEEHEKKPLSKSSIVLFCYIAANGMASWRHLQRKLHFSSSTLSKAFKELKERGLLDVLSGDGAGALKIEAAGAFKIEALSKSKQEDFLSTSKEERSASKIEAHSLPLSIDIYKRERDINNSALKIEALRKLKQKGSGKNERFKNPAVKPSPFDVYELIAKKSV